MVIPKRSKGCILSGMQENFSEIIKGTPSIADMAYRLESWYS